MARVREGHMMMEAGRVKEVIAREREGNEMLETEVGVMPSLEGARECGLELGNGSPGALAG